MSLQYLQNNSIKLTSSMGTDGRSGSESRMFEAEVTRRFTSNESAASLKSSEFLGISDEPLVGLLNDVKITLRGDSRVFEVTIAAIVTGEES